MVKTAHLSGAGLLVGLLAACSMAPVNAPVVSLGTVPQTHQAGPAGAHTKGEYLVRRGDTLYSVAWQNGLNFRQLAEMNAIRPPYTIYIGQSLHIAPPAGARSTPLSTAGPAPASRPPAAPEAQPGSTGSPPVPRHGTVMATPVAVPKRAAVPELAAGNEPALPAIVTHWVWPARGPLLRGYTPDATGKKGIDIGGKIGQPIVSAADGKVVYSGSGLVGYGRLIIIKHNDSLLSAYGHNSELLVTEGDYVKAGQVIAKMGSSGTSSARLYFEIRQDGKPVNPLRYLPHG
jgi:lipoprotein NlpD